MIAIEKMFWNPTIANLTLMALGSSAPEIILSVADTMGTLGEIPSELGPQSIVGSAAFNLLVISAVSIVAVDEIKKINMVGVFLATAIFSSWAYVWFFLVLVVISPGVVELWEAGLTLGFMLILVIIAYSCDLCHTKGETKEERKKEEHRKAAKAAIRVLTKKFGMKAMLEVGQGNTPTLQKPL
jgi:Ca2+/Na+ antiporter